MKKFYNIRPVFEKFYLCKNAIPSSICVVDDCCHVCDEHFYLILGLSANFDPCRREHDHDME